jgi:hypothetical protein
MNVIKADAAKPVAPLTVEVSDDQTSVLATRRLEFVEAFCVTGQCRCLFCVANYDQELCDSLPCRWNTRKDGRNGYWREVSL